MTSFLVSSDFTLPLSSVTPLNVLFFTSGSFFGPTFPVYKYTYPSLTRRSEQQYFLNFSLDNCAHERETQSFAYSIFPSTCSEVSSDLVFLYRSTFRTFAVRFRSRYSNKVAELLPSKRLVVAAHDLSHSWARLKSSRGVLHEKQHRVRSWSRLST